MDTDGHATHERIQPYETLDYSSAEDLLRALSPIPQMKTCLLYTSLDFFRYRDCSTEPAPLCVHLPTYLDIKLTTIQLNGSIPEDRFHCPSPTGAVERRRDHATYANTNHEIRD